MRRRVRERELVQLLLERASHDAGAAIQQTVGMKRLAAAETCVGDEYARR